MAERRLTHRLGNRVVDGVELRSLPQVELPWITTFNMRWWDHADEVGYSRRQAATGQGWPFRPDLRQRDPMGGLDAPASSRILASTTTAPDRMDHEWVEVHLRDFGVSLDQGAHTKQNILQRADVCALGAAVSIEQRKCLQRADHAVGVALGDGSDANRHIFQQLRRGAAGAAGEHGSEMLVLDHPHQHLDSLRHHRLELESGDVVASRTQGVRHLPRSLLDLDSRP